MVNWLSPHILHVSAQYAQKVNTFLFGLYSWHFLCTLRHVEIPLIMRKLRFRWAFIPYICARYLLLATTVGFELNLCGPANKTLWFLGCMAMIFASENFVLRATTLWRGNLWGMLFLIAMALGHWAVGIVVFFVPLVDAWVQYENTCETITGTGGPVPFYLYTMLLDLATLVFTIYGLLRIRGAGSSPLWTHLCRQGLGYFAITFLANILTLVFALMKLNGTPSRQDFSISEKTKAAVKVYVGDIFSAPGVTISVIASSRAVVSLLKMREGRSSGPSGRADAYSTKSRSQAFSTNVTAATYRSIVSMKFLDRQF
ncbi:uncharacterized protein PHACADRAFT_211751 [Phanerochaete carnosa HHB-10118-sp]|uniref:Uncharacterized protein n=1 Tax=Phanerochaete carnosa (strain HHB-10118-sp) TaxID=650164 RepID=K5URI3_PHACS|nr:uncharacterized protein PHACADRAFT_211751 [Phanerochaete carnosa HHB-10118-sp]EKM52501.1 hypothetical protein PHACADRAFT_211751 [Phanerochaete carnosa HHB-10118-sp]